ncbi:hypothetical protein SO694_00041228 [Aureococcus anophagefferens]|uniref:Uncharacterized protein n=1 Tax=Aureococcus anophagefferens TaxID=44056 RepID=A0ABR1G6K7_AURAN
MAASEHPLISELEACLAALDGVDKTIEDRSPSGAAVNDFFKALASLETVVTAHPEVQFPAEALEPGCDWDRLAASTLREPRGPRALRAPQAPALDLAALVEAGLGWREKEGGLKRPAPARPRRASRPRPARRTARVATRAAPPPPPRTAARAPASKNLPASGAA